MQNLNDLGVASSPIGAIPCLTNCILNASQLALCFYKKQSGSKIDNYTYLLMKVDRKKTYCPVSLIIVMCNVR